jgi:hypothetical protein
MCFPRQSNELLLSASGFPRRLTINNVPAKLEWFLTAVMAMIIITLSAFVILWVKIKGK